MSKKDEVWEKYTTEYDQAIRIWAEDIYTDEFKEGFYIAEIIRKQNGDWLFHWKRDIGGLVRGSRRTPETTTNNDGLGVQSGSDVQPNSQRSK